MTDGGTIREDGELAALARSGSLSAFEELVRRHERSIHAFVRRRVASREDAEDLTQQAFLTAWRQLARYRSEYPFAGWLFTIARRLTISHYRRARPAAEPEGEETADGARDPAAALAVRDDAERLWRLARATLSERQFSALWLMYEEDRSVAEIARAMGLLQPHVKVLLHRARRRLHGRLQAAEPAAAPPAAGREAWAGTPSKNRGCA